MLGKSGLGQSDARKAQKREWSERPEKLEIRNSKQVPIIKQHKIPNKLVLVAIFEFGI
jgi:hypothetical protein